MDIKENIISTYEKVLNGDQKAFSPYFFQIQYRKERIETLIRYFVEEKLKITPQEALKEMTTDLLIEYKLNIILKYIDKPVEFVENDARHVVYYAYPDLEQASVSELAICVYKEILDSRRRIFPKNYFRDGDVGEERAIACFKYLCEEVLHLSDSEIKETFMTSKGLEVLSKYKLKIIMNILFFSPIDLLQCAYPNIVME